MPFVFRCANLPVTGNPASPAGFQLMPIVTGILRNHNKALLNSNSACIIRIIMIRFVRESSVCI